MKFASVMRALAIFWGAAALFFFSAPAFANTIKSFDSVIHINKDASLDITENIAIDFGDVPQRGLLRRLVPTVYERDGNKYTYQIKVYGVKNEEELPVDFDSADLSDHVQILVHEDKALTGVHTFRIHYTVRRAVFFVDRQPEIHWNVTGTEWQFPIESAQAELYVPPNTQMDLLRAQAFAGPEGSTESAEVIPTAEGIECRAKNLKPGEGLVLNAKLPEGSVLEPGLYEQLVWFMEDWWLTVILPVMALSCMYLMWWSHGRDQKEAAVPSTQPEWQPPKDLPPAEVGTLIDERCDIQDVIATVIDLAVRGHLRLREIQIPGHLKDYEFVKLEGPRDDALTGYEKAFMAGIFGQGAAGTMVRLSQLRERFFIHLPPIRNAIYTALTNKGMFVRNPDEVRTSYYVLAAGAAVLGVLSSALHHLPLGLGLIIAGAIVASFAPAMPARTAKGARTTHETREFQQFVRLAEKEKIQTLFHNDPGMFGRLLPYALVLGAGDQWAEAFCEILTGPPSWYEYDSPDQQGSQNFTARSFVANLGDGLQSMERVLSSSPSGSRSIVVMAGGGTSNGSANGGGH